VELLKKKNSKFYWYDFTVRGQRYRGSTKETNMTRAGKIAALKLTHAIEGQDPLDRKAPTLLEFSSRFVEWVKTARLEFDTRRYYLNGWRLLQTTQLPNMRLDRITADMVVIFNSNSKTKKGRRFIPMSDRAMNILLVRCADRTEGWVFPSRQKGKHITGGLVNKQWVRARKKAGLPEDLVLRSS
jgi:integrase